ncbi:MAG: hypothetical protein ABIR36_15000 [Nitrospiraceae bacterium]
MNCVGCNGCVVAEQLSDPRGTSERIEAVCCLNCGNIEDAIIESNWNRHLSRLSLRAPGFSVAGRFLDRWVNSA